MMACITRTYFNSYNNNKSQTKSIKLVQHKCPNCSAKLDTRKCVYDGYIENKNGQREELFYERNYIKCDFCRSEFELYEEEE